MDIAALINLPEDELNILMADLEDEDIDAIKRAIADAEAERLERLEKLGEAIAKKRAEAISAREKSGIEAQWTEDEEFYEGIDDANRGEDSTWSSKPVGMADIGDDDDTSSTIFLNITGPYVDAASASLSDMLLPTDDSGWQIVNTPIPDLIPMSDGEIPPHIDQAIQAEADMASQGDPAARDQIVEQGRQDVVSQAMAMRDEAKEKAEKAQRRIEDWHVECRYHAEVRKVIEDAAKVGSGVLKGPFPVKQRRMSFMDGALVLQEEIKPASKRIDYRNLFPDGACGGNIHNGSYVFERDDITSRQLRDLIGVPGYIESEILAVLEEGPSEADKEFRSSEELKRREGGLYEIWYYYGDLTKEDLEVTGCECEGESESIPAQIVMVNNRVIKGAMSHLDTGEFPYDIMNWKKRENSPWGTGIARAIRTPQRMINGAARNLMDNAGLAGGPMWAYKPGIIEPMDGIASLSPRKGWVASEDADQEAMANAFTYFKLDMMVNELQTIIYLGLKMAEDVTGLPMIMQGQMGAQKLDTLGQTELLNNNANIVRRRIARLFDDLVTEPHVSRYYTYLLQYGEDDEKGDFIVDARGSSNLVERAIQKEKMGQWLATSTNPIFGMDPKKVAVEMLKADKLDPKNFEYDDDEWKQVVERMSAPQDPRSEVAQLNAEVKREIEKVRQVMQDKEHAHDERMKAAELQSEERKAQLKAQIDEAVAVFEGDLKKQLAEMKYQGDKDLQFDKLKTSLNETVMRLSTTKELAGQKATADLLPKPPVEPPQQAPAGESYQQ